MLQFLETLEPALWYWMIVTMYVTVTYIKLLWTVRLRVGAMRTHLLIWIISSL